MNKKKVFSIGIVLLLFILSTVGGIKAYDFGKIDLQGQTINVISWTDRLQEIRDKIPGRIEEAEKRFNCKIVYQGLPYDKMNEGLMNRLLAGESTLDIWNINHEIFWKLLPQNVFAPVNDVVNEQYYQRLPQEHQNTMNVLSYQGKKYGFSTFGTLFGAMRFVIFNKDMFENAGLQNPHYYYQQGEWTWEKAAELAKALTKDNNGDGEIDQYGFGHIWRYDLVLANGSRLTREKDQQRIFSMDEPAALEAFETYYRWSSVEGIAELGDNSGDNFRDGRYAMQPIEVWRIHWIRGGFNFEFGIVPLPLGPKAERYAYPQLSMETFVLPANAQEKKALIAVADFLWQPDDYDTQDYIVENAPDRLSASIWWEGLQTWDGDILMLSSILPDEWEEAMEAIENADKTPAAAIAEVKGKVQASINDLFNY